MSLPQPPEPPEQRTPPLGEPRRQQPAKDEWVPVAGRPGFFRDQLGRLKYRPPGF